MIIVFFILLIGLGLFSHFDYIQNNIHNYINMYIIYVMYMYVINICMLT